MSQTPEPVFGGGFSINDPRLSDRDALAMTKQLLFDDVIKLTQIKTFKNVKVAYFETADGEILEVPLKDEDIELVEKMAEKNSFIENIQRLCLDPVGIKKMKEYLMILAEFHCLYGLLLHLVESGEQFGDSDGEYLYGCDSSKKLYEVFGSEMVVRRLFDSFIGGVGKAEGKTNEQIVKMADIYQKLTQAKLDNGDFHRHGTIHAICERAKKLTEIVCPVKGKWFIKKDEHIGKVHMLGWNFETTEK